MSLLISDYRLQVRTMIRDIAGSLSLTGTINTGTNTLTISNANNSLAVNQVISVQGAGVGGGMLSSIIQAINGITITLRDNASTTVTNAIVTAVTNPALYIFQDSEIDTFTQTAVQAYSKYRGRRKPYTLNLVAGQSQYTLPTDWVKPNFSSFNAAIQPAKDINIHEFASFVLPNINNAYLLKDLTFDWYDSDQFVIVNPTPQANAGIPFSYYAAHTVDANGSSIPAADSDYVVLAAASRALDDLAIDRGLKMQKYKIGQGLNIDDSEVAIRMQEQAKTYWERFEKFVCYRPLGVSG